MSENDWETISDYYSELDGNSLLSLVVRSLIEDSDSDEDEEISSVERMEDNAYDGFHEAQECFAQPKRHIVKKNSDEVLLNSGSTISILNDEHLVKSIRPS